MDVMYARTESCQPGCWLLNLPHGFADDFSIVQLSYILWSFSKLGVHHPQLVDNITTAMLPKMDSRASHAMTISAWSLAVLKHYDSMTGVLLDAVAEVLISDVSAFRTKVITTAAASRFAAFMPHMHLRAPTHLP